jgi:hypothetical protein
MEKDVEKWLRYYLPERFPLPFGDGHKKIISAAVRAREQGTSITVAAPRAEGKTSILWGICLYWVLTGRGRFPIMLGWTHTASKEAILQWLNALSTNERLREAYPCVCEVFAESTAGLRLKSLTRELGAEPVGADVRKGDGVIVLPDQKEDGRYIPQAVLGSASINGAVKGTNVGVLSGETLRPDIALLDDPQDVETATSQSRIDTVIRNIDFGVRSLGDIKNRVTVMAAVTCVAHGDVSEHLLTRPGTEAIKYGQILAWPTGFEDLQSKVRQLWEEWNALRVEGLATLQGVGAAKEFYRANKKTLTQGMKVSWRERYTENDPDAFYAAMWDFYELGELAFMAERQNAPVKTSVTLYNLTPQVVVEKTNPERAKMELPEWAQVVIAATDVNPSYALTTGLRAFGAGRRSAILDYWQMPMNVRQEQTDAEKTQLAIEALGRLGKILADVEHVPRLWVIDGAGVPAETVNSFAGVSMRYCGIQAIAAYGRAGTNYRPTSTANGRGRVDFEESHIVIDGMRRWIIWNADYWREQAQRAWTGTPGAPGTCELPAGEHRQFATEICNERLIGKGEVGGKMVWRWETAGVHDYGDVMAMSEMGAAVAGIGLNGAKPQTQHNKRRARAPKVTWGRV